MILRRRSRYRWKLSRYLKSNGGPILAVVSNIGDDVQYRCFNYLYDVKSVPHPDTIALLGNNNCLQITETGFAEQFYVSHRMGPALI